MGVTGVSLGSGATSGLGGLGARKYRRRHRNGLRRGGLWRRRGLGARRVRGMAVMGVTLGLGGVSEHGGVTWHGGLGAWG